MCSAPPEVNVKISSEVETGPTRTTDYNVHNDHQKISVTIDKGQNPGHFWKINSPVTILKPEKKNMSG